MKRSKKNINIIEQYFEQMNFLTIDVIAVIVAAIGVIMFFLGLYAFLIAIPLILIAGVIKFFALLHEIKDSDFDDMVNHLKELADINYKDSEYNNKTFFEIYDLTEQPVRLGRDQNYRSNHLTISLFAFEKKNCIIELYHFNIKENTFSKEEFTVPVGKKTEIVSVANLIEKHYSSYLTVEGEDGIKIPVRSGSMDLEEVIEKLEGRR